MKDLLQFSAVIALCCVSWSVIHVTRAAENFLGRIGDQAQDIAGSVGTVSQVATDLDDKLTPAIEQMPKDLNRRLDALVETWGPVPAEATRMLDARLNDANETLAKLGTATAEAEGELAKDAAPIRDLAQQFNAAAPLWLDCEYNPDCAFNRYQGTMKAVELSAQQAPGTAAAWKNISLDLNRVADRLTAKKRWYQHLGDGIFLASGLAKFF